MLARVAMQAASLDARRRHEQDAEAAATAQWHERRNQVPSFVEFLGGGMIVDTIEVGGGIAHHHGVGRVRREALPREIGETGVALLREIKRAPDPEDLMNPRVLLPDEMR